jgi:NADPH-dependent 2,4-dienoyl-CoA reductase/sulfur reductase-like enzyme
VHILVIGTGAAARNAAIAARRAGTGAVTLIRSGGGGCDELTSASPCDVRDLRELAEAGVTVELHTFATFIDTDRRSVWVDCGEHQEVIAYDQLIVCTAPAQTTLLLAGADLRARPGR